VRTLFLDLASHEGCIACCDTAQVLAFEPASPGMRDDALIPAIERVLATANTSWQSLTHVACVTGPGGFTSLRVGVTCANTVADQRTLPIAGVHLSDVYHARSGKADCLWLHSTRKHELFVRGFGTYATNWPEPILVQLEEFVPLFPTNALWMGECIAEHSVALAARSPQQAKLREVQEVLPALLAGLPYSNAPLMPWYGRGF
jgi:tRNA threonylcarbamoyl adenosine modification protein YeaZ